jgi:hypothetical protein
MWWNVTITRTAIASRDVEVEADTREEAEAKALEDAGDLDFSGCVQDYEMDTQASPSDPTEPDLESEENRCPDLNGVVNDIPEGVCSVCQVTSFPGVSDETIDAGWLPSYFIGEEEQSGPVCPNCAAQFIVIDPKDGESVLNLKGEYVSQWGGGIEVKSPCTVDPRTRKIEIEHAGDVEGLETMEREYFVLNGTEYEAANEEERFQYSVDEQAGMFFYE